MITTSRNVGRPAAGGGHTTGVGGGGGRKDNDNDSRSSSSDCSVDEKDSSTDGDNSGDSGDDGDNDDASRSSVEQQQDDEDDDGLSETPTTQSGRFIKTMYDMIEKSHANTPQAICWSDGGKSFIIDPEQDEFQQIIDKTLGCKYLYVVLLIKAIFF